MKIKRFRGLTIRGVTARIFTYRQGLKENAIHNFADFCDIDTVQDKTLGRELRTYAFYLKGNFKSYGIAAKDTDRDYYVRTDCYDKDDNYLSALEAFNENYRERRNGQSAYRG